MTTKELPISGSSFLVATILRGRCLIADTKLANACGLIVRLKNGEWQKRDLHLLPGDKLVFDIDEAEAVIGSKDHF